MNIPSLKEIGDKYDTTVEVTWKNQLTGESGSSDHRFYGECIFDPFWLLIGVFKPLCNTFSDESSISITVALAVGDNEITVEAVDKSAAVTVTRTPPDDTVLPLVQTLPTTQIGANAANLPGIVNPNNSATDAWFEYSTDPGLSLPSVTPVQQISGSSDINVSGEAINLDGQATYYYRVTASNRYGTAQGQILSFETEAGVVEQVPTIDVGAG